MSMNEAPSPEEGFDATDAKIDALLQDFFRAETPAVLPSAPIEAPDDWTTLAPIEAAPGRRWFSKDFATPALLASVAVLLVCGLMMLPRHVGHANEQALKPPLPPSPGETTAVPAVWTPDVVGFPESPTRIRGRSQSQRVKDGAVNVTVADGSTLVDLKYYETSLGPVEQRTNVEWTKVRVWEPESGEWLEATVPKVRVDVVALGQ